MSVRSAKSAVFESGLPGLTAVDLSHPFGMHTPGWANYPPVKISYFQRLSSHDIVAQYVETPLHVSTHIDAPMHAVPAGGDVASLPLSRLFGEGVIVDISDRVSDWSVITPDMLTARADIRRGDIVLYYTGYKRFYPGERTEDEPRYFLRHPGGGRELAQWIVDMDLAWTGVDCASADHPMNTTIKRMRPDIAREFDSASTDRGREAFSETDLFVMHRVPFRRNIVHVENLGGDVETLLNRRCLIGAFPWKFIGGEASICRVVAFVSNEA
jgi:kynurenine formamidase